jgi:hypothetical protein
MIPSIPIPHLSNNTKRKHCKRNPKYVQLGDEGDEEKTRKREVKSKRSAATPVQDKTEQEQCE